MSRILVLLLFVFLALILVGCEDEETVYDPAPPAPQGVYSVTGNNAVYIYWQGPYDRDIKEYVIWRSFDPYENYQPVGTRLADNNPNLDLIYYEYIDGTAVNGTTYYYAVTSVDAAGQSSELSAENVFDTPRPEGSVTLVDMAVDVGSAGFSFSSASVVSRNSSSCDVFIDSDVNGQLYVNAGDVDNLRTRIQDMGYTADFDEIGWAPQTGWSMLGWAQVIGGHTYVVLTDNDHYAKIRVTAYDEVAGTVSFDYAYQTDQDNPELAPAGPDNESHTSALQ